MAAFCPFQFTERAETSKEPASETVVELFLIIVEVGVLRETFSIDYTVRFEDVIIEHGSMLHDRKY